MINTVLFPFGWSIIYGATACGMGYGEAVTGFFHGLYGAPLVLVWGIVVNFVIARPAHLERKRDKVIFWSYTTLLPIMIVVSFILLFATALYCPEVDW